MRTALFLGLLAACSDAAVPISISGPTELEPALRELVELTPYDGLRFGGREGFAIEVVLDETCRECYRIEAVGDAQTVHAGDVLGAQYGVAHALENLGFRFRTPTATLVPDPPVLIPGDSALHEPEVKGQRGLQLHTLHPIEAYFALWAPGDDRTARQIFDWIVKNRGNHVQWPALDDIMQPARHAEWKAQTQHLLDIAHMRGLDVALGVQIFGSGNMQQAFDLSDDDTGTVPFESELAQRLPLVTDDLAFDGYVLSFGEFFGEDPDRFIAAVDATASAIHAAKPEADIHASIHVGADQRVDYLGEQQLPYYFLVKHADPSIVSNVHTVMFYNLFEDAGGAYEHADFSEHREYLFEQMRAGRRACYYPESAYWIAFDNSVPLFLPVYVRSRWLDLDGIARQAHAENLAGLDGHLIFSSGWEWGYWLNDYASLRASYHLPASQRELIADAYGRDLGPAADLVAELAETQARRLIHDRLAPYLAGRDILIDAGDKLGIHSQPDRVTFDELAMFDEPARTTFVAEVLTPLQQLVDELTDLDARFTALQLADSPWSRELADGFAVTAARARFIHAAYRAVLDRTDDTAARAALAEGHAAVQRRHAQPHYTGPREHLFGEPTNATVYGFGYLSRADTLCYWERELVQLDNALNDTTEPVPSCYL